ncbi:hypothetical protein Tco_0673060 [Tanacetum coccineum]
MVSMRKHKKLDMHYRFVTTLFFAFSLASSSLLQKHIDSKSISNNMLPKAVMKGSRSNATKESINEDNSLSEMVKNVKYHSTLANLKSILGQGGTSIYLL